jgi:hypothetical protein
MESVGRNSFTPLSKVCLYVFCECCVLSGRSLCVGLITRPEEPTECGVAESDRGASIMKRPWPTRGC